MSEYNPSDVKLEENQDGTVSFAPEVVATIAGLAATEVEGVASMTSTSSGFADMFARKNTKSLTKGVKVDLEGSTVCVDITITVEYGNPVPDVARGIQENVKKAIETMSGLNVEKIDIHVSGISFEKEQRANEELDEQQRKMLEESGIPEEPETVEVEDAKEETEEPIMEASEDSDADTPDDADKPEA